MNKENNNLINFWRSNFLLLLSLSIVAFISMILLVHFNYLYNSTLINRHLEYIPVLFIINVLLSIIWLISHENLFFKIIIPISKFLILNLIIIPINNDILIILLCHISLFMELSFFLGPGYLSLSTVIVLGSSLTTLTERKAWDYDLKGMNDSDIFFVISVSLITTLFCSILKYYYFKSRSLKLELTQMQDSIQKIINANVSFQDLALGSAKISQEKERNRITREVHDIVGHTLTSQIMVLEALKVLNQEPNSEEKKIKLIENALTQSREGMRDIRKTLHVLRDTTEQELFHTKIMRLCKSFGRITQLKIEIMTTFSLNSLNKELEPIIFRIIQESLTNSFLHGKAKHVDIYFRVAHQNLLLDIQDDGQGANNIKEGIGITGMKERLSPVYGNLSYKSSAYGFQLKIEIPLRGIE